MKLIEAENVAATETTLIVISQGDIASKNQGDALLEKLSWEEIQSVEGHPSFKRQHVRMWWLPDGVLWEDDIDGRWKDATGEQLAEVIFPSRHSASSGRPSLTMHPIGVPQYKTSSEVQYGGRAGTTVPPNQRISDWWKLFHKKKQDANALSKFELTLEVTHHGPFLQTPSMFIEIGSTADTWGDLNAASFLADVMIEGLGLETGLGIGGWDKYCAERDLVVITLGGGHYAPRANYIGLLPHVRLGHMLASYALPFGEKETPNDQWKNSLQSALSSTKISYPGGRIVCMIEKKAFKGWQRDLLKEFCSELGLEILQRKDIEQYSESKLIEERVKD
jgi:D-aminoacyl-tRNA deacylase